MNEYNFTNCEGCIMFVPSELITPHISE